MLTKDANERITIDELKNHPWITKRGTNPLIDNKGPEIIIDTDDLDDISINP